MDEPSPPTRSHRTRARPRAPLAAAALVATLVLPAACLAPAARDGTAAAPRPGDAYRLVTGETRSVAGRCRYAYRVYEPDTGAAATDTPANVILGHGFLRDQDTMVGLARALAAAGLRVATLDFCNMRPWSGHHARNARDMRALAERLAGAYPDGGRIYAGFSAGALAALLAASEDPDALGVLALDPVDQDGLGRAAVARLEAPLLGLAGPPSACNARGSARALFADGAGASATLETIAGADHCEFESPSDGLCERLCGDEDGASDDALTRERVIRRAVEMVLGLLPAGPPPAAPERPGSAAPTAWRAAPSSPPPRGRRGGGRPSVSIRSRKPCRGAAGRPYRLPFHCSRSVPRLSSRRRRGLAPARSPRPAPHPADLSP